MIKLPDNVRQAGLDIADYLMTASVRRAMGGDNLGGCKSYKLEDFPDKYHDLITAYLNDNIISVEGIYIAMKRAEKESNNE